MASYFYICLLAFYISSSCVFFLPFVLSVEPNLPFKAVNLGGWLVAEGWMKPSLFEGIPNPHLLLWRINESTFNFRVSNKQFVGLSNRNPKIRAVAVSNTPGTFENFEIVGKNDDVSNHSLVRIKASNGRFLQAKTDTLVTADFGDNSGWGDDDPSVFKMTIVGKPFQGEFQLTNGYGPEKAPQVMNVKKFNDNHNTNPSNTGALTLWKRISNSCLQKGLNAVRIPVGWWIASDPRPPAPFVGGSLQALDNAFKWAQRSGMKITVDLHAVPGSQNGNDHSGSRDGFQEWGDSNIQQTVAVIDFLAARYSNHPSLAAVELMNEPSAPGVTFENLSKFYRAGYNAVRKHTSSAYVILSARLGPADPKEFLRLARGLKGSVIDVHYYNRFSKMYKNKTVQWNIDNIYKERAENLSMVTSSDGRPLSFVGEWTGERKVNGATKNDYQRFAKAQLEVYGRATFGWAYWSYKNVNKHWTLKWMIENNYIKL